MVVAHPVWPKANKLEMIAKQDTPNITNGLRILRRKFLILFTKECHKQAPHKKGYQHKESIHYLVFISFTLIHQQ